MPIKRKTRSTSDMVTAAIRESINREREAMRVYRPGNEKQLRVNASPASTLIVSGLNRSGKTVCSIIEFASRITGERLCGLDNSEIPARFPVPDGKRKYVYWLIGYNLDHIGQTFYRVLFEPGLFDVICDDKGKWVAFNENDPWHRQNADRKVPCEPVIPSRLINHDTWTWNAQGGGKAKNCFSSVELLNGAVIYAFPSTTPQPKQGDPVDGILVDEDVAYGNHVPEYIARLADRGGWFMWPAWPHDDNYVLTNMIRGCEVKMDEGDSRFEAVRLTMVDNPFFSDAKKQLQVDRFSMLGDEAMDSRVHGILGHDRRKMYDFNPMEHGISSPMILRPVPELDDLTPRGALQRVYRDSGRFPAEWTRYLGIDPSTQRSAVLFGVVPPPEVKGVAVPPSLIIEGEVVLKRCTPTHLAMAVKEQMANRNYEAFVIDRNFGRQKHFAANGVAAWDVLAKEFKKHGVASRMTQNYFVPGNNQVLQRQETVRNLLGGELLEGPRLYVLLDATPETQREFERYLKKETTYKGVQVVEDTPENPRKFDCMAALEYMADFVYTLMQASQHYVSPQAYQGDSGMTTLARTVMGLQADKEYIHLGPGTKA